MTGRRLLPGGGLNALAAAPAVQSKRGDGDEKNLRKADADEAREAVNVVSQAVSGID
jgi:hypothetical protein